MFSKLGLSFTNQNTGSKSAARPVLGEDEEINLLALKTMKEPMKLVSKFISANNPQALTTPFKGTDCRFIKNESILLFTSGNGRIAKLNLSDSSIISDAHIDDKAIWTLEISNDEEFVYLGGASNVIKRYRTANFEQAGRYKGHNGEVFMILLSPDSRFMYSASADRSVKQWDVNNNSSSTNIVEHKAAVQAIDLSQDGNYLMTGSIDKTACLLRNERSKWEIKGTIQCESEVFAVKISLKLKFVVTGENSGDLISWSFETLEPKRRYRDKEKIWCIDIADSEEFVVTGGLSNNIVLWDMLKQREKVELKGHSKQIKSVQITKDQKSIVSLSNDCKVIRWKIPMFEERNVLTADQSIKSLWFSDENALLYAHIIDTNNDVHAINAWNLINYSKVKEFVLSEPRICFYQKSKDDKLFYVIYKVDYNYHFGAYDLISSEKAFSHDLGALEITCFEVSKDHQYLFIGQTFKIQTYLINKDYEIFNSQIYHNSRVMQIACTPSSKFILSYDNMGIIKLIDVELMANNDVRNDLEELVMFKTAEASIQEIKLINEETLVAVSRSLILIWSISKRAIIKMMNRDNFCSVDSSLDDRFIFLRSEQKIEVWTTENFSYNSFIQYPDALESFHISPDNKYIAISRGQQVLVSRSHLAARSIYICGDVSRKNEYFSYMSSIIDDSSEKFNSDFDDWIIEPFHINSLHFYAYYNFDEYLAQAIRNGAPFFCTAHGHNPLSIALELDFPNCISAIIREIRSAFDTNHFIYFTIENSLAALNNSGYERLHSLYDNLFCKTRNLSLPKFCENQPSFPIVTVSDSFIIDKEAFAKQVSFSVEGNSIVFSKSYVKLPILAGTSESIEFIQSIENCKNTRIFATEFTQILLEQKWNQVKWVAYTQSIIFIIYLVLLSLYTVEYRNEDFLIAPFVLNCYFCLYEISYMASSRGKYFLDPWNYMDLLRISSLFTYVILIWLDIYPHHEWFLATVILISWIRGVAYFRIFKATRYLINLLITACKDIIAFLAILFYSTISFGLIFYALYPYQLSDGSIDTDFFTYATKFYDLNIGNSDTSNYGKLEWLFYVAVTILNPIIMINLLISILGNTYETVNQNEVVNDAKELISLILESELLMFWRRGVNDKKYLHMCDEMETEITADEDNLKKKIKMLKSRVVKLTDDMAKEEGCIVAITKDIQRRNTEIASVIEKLEIKRDRVKKE